MLKVLDLSNTALVVDSASILAEGLKLSQIRLTHLNINNNEIDLRGAQEFAKYIEGIDTL